MKTILMATILFTLLSGREGLSAQYYLNMGLGNAAFQLNHVQVIDKDGTKNSVSAKLMALDGLSLHGGQIYQLNNTGAASGEVDATFAKAEGKLIIPLLVQTNTTSYNLTLLNTNGLDGKRPMQFTVTALSMSSYSAGAPVKVVFIEGPRGEKGEKGEKGDPGQGAPSVGNPPSTNPANPPPSSSTPPVVNPPQQPVAQFKVGDIGPGGGIIFYVDATGLHGLEAQKSDFPERKGLNWSAAIDAAASYGEGWHLPSKTELALLFKNKSVVGDASFKNNSIDYKTYWSSTSYDTTAAWYSYFGNGSQNTLVKTYETTVRAVRSF